MKAADRSKPAAFIYALWCPLSKSIRYIGKTVDVQQRLSQHLISASAGKLSKPHGDWLRWLLAASAKPVAIQLFVVPADMRWQDAERFFIASSRALGFALTNATHGGNGLCTEDEAAVEERRAALRAAWAKPGAREHRTAITRERMKDPDARARMVDASHSAAAQAKRVASCKAYAASEEGKRTLSKTWSDLWAKPEMKARKSEASKAAWADPIKAAARRAAMSEGKRLGWARKKAQQA